MVKVFQKTKKIPSDINKTLVVINFCLIYSIFLDLFTFKFSFKSLSCPKLNSRAQCTHTKHL